MSGVIKFFLRFLAFLLVFLLGFLSCVGALGFGGYYLFTKGSYDTVRDTASRYGQTLPDASAIFDPNAEVKLTALSISQLIGEYKTLSGTSDTVTVDYLIHRYGIIGTPKDIAEKVPASVRGASLKEFAASGYDINVLLQETTMGEIFALASVPGVSDSFKDGLSDKHVTDLIAGNFEAFFGDLTFGDVLFNKKDGEYVDKSGTPLSGMDLALAKMKITPLLDENADFLAELTKGMAVGELLGYTPVYDESEPPVRIGWTNGGVDVTGAIKVISDKELNKLGQQINDIRIGEIVGFENRDDVWYDGENPATGLLAAFSDLKLNELSDGAAVTAKVQAVKIGDALGFENREGVWYDGENPASGVLGAIADSEIGNIEATVNGTEIGKLLGYEYNEAEHVWYDGVSPVTPLMNTVANAKVTEVGGVVDSLTIGDVFDSGDFDSGFLSILKAAYPGNSTDPDAYLAIPVTAIPDAVANTMDAATMDTIMAGGVFALDAETVSKLDLVDSVKGNPVGTWRTKTFEELLPYILG